MIELLKRPDTVRKAEVGVAAFVYLFLVFFLLTGGLGDTPKYQFDQVRLPFGYYENYLFPNLVRYTVLFGAFLLLHLRVIPRLLRREEVFSHAVFTFLIFLGMGLVLGVADTYRRYYLYGTPLAEDASYSEGAFYGIVFRDSFVDGFILIVMVAVYNILRHLALRLLAEPDSIPPRYRPVTRDGLGALAVWFASLVLLLLAQVPGELVLGWGTIIPTGTALYGLAFFRLIPASLGKKRPPLAYLLRIVLTLVASVVPLFLLLTALSNDAETALGITSFAAVCHLVITAPLAWVLFGRYARGNEELFVLKKELGQTHANVDFLRSQINPHFLFNALNTIYGTAIQEKAERTSEGIEKLGDMMRFMLQENMQEKIPLVREVEYLTNYVSLQKLRTDPNPSIRVQVEIQPPLHPVQIAPMLLIPFVENAFKHGISFREPSHIVISLEVREGTLDFDVHNSRHTRQGSDPEKDHSGIGLPNVRQRLQLLYPGRHELMIRETAREFFVHLTLRLQ
ncbi:sensor histidine kinase [Salmonirosea aquatica]|uniref:Sensor histidine kinase n=1 Tax=Salmonirosea aquatica TaxID=2654236 RepID=A0A7C9FZQ5_9BACT|nr:sensor histidine kinase [Cytophagaceae bacterium SJW1-29]